MRYGASGTTPGEPMDDGWDGRGGVGGTWELRSWRGGRRPRPGRRGLRLAAWCAATALLLVISSATYLYLRFDGNVRGVDINGLLGGHRPADPHNGSMDILVLGSDSRSGANREAGGGTDDGTARSDTAMVIHLHRGHRDASIVSIPRDTLVDRPACRKPDGTDVPAASGVMFNEAYGAGGPACAVRTVETMTGVRMDHYAEVDFTGFQRLVDALGGVKITTARDIADDKSHLRLKAGTHLLDGRQALGLVRTRHGVGDGSDLGRVRLQQAFIRALADRVNSLGLLTSPSRLYTVADSATGALTTDSELASVQALVEFAERLKHLRSERIVMVTMPVRYDVDDPNRVVPYVSEDRQVWAALRADRPIPRAVVRGSAAQDPTAAAVFGAG
jgi:LCP family protein required for cell wall assembly